MKTDISPQLTAYNAKIRELVEALAEKWQIPENSPETVKGKRLVITYSERLLNLPVPKDISEKDRAAINKKRLTWIHQKLVMQELLRQQEK